MITFNNKILLIGSLVGGLGKIYRAWEGVLDKTNNHITWNDISSVTKKREAHFSLLVDDKVYVLGGYDIEDYFMLDDRMEIWDGREWKVGPEFDFEVPTANAQAVVDRKTRIILTTNLYGGTTNI